MNLIFSSQVLLNVQVSIHISSFPGFYKIVDSCGIFPNFASIEMFLSLIAYSLKSSNFPIIEFITIVPFFGISYFFSFFFGFYNSFDLFFNSSSLFFWIYNSSFSFLVLNITSTSNSRKPIYLWVFFTTIFKGNFTCVFRFFLKFKSKMETNLSTLDKSIRFFLLTFFFDLTDLL